MTHTLETTGDLARRRPRAAAERGSRRGDRARARHGPHAVRPRGRGGARRGAARALRRAASATTSSRCRIARAAEPHPRGLRRDPHAHRRARAGDARGEDRPHRRPRRVHQPRHRRRAPLRAPRPSGDLPRDEIELLGADRLGADRHARPRPRRVVRGRRRHRPERRDRRGDALAALVHVRARLPRRRRSSPSTSARAASCARSSTRSWTIRAPAPGRGELAERITDYSRA